jgi:hypothetical protein
MSAPTEKVRSPAPVITRARSAGSPPSSGITSSRRSTIAIERRLWGGSWRTTVATAPLLWTMIFSVGFASLFTLLPPASKKRRGR